MVDLNKNSASGASETNADTATSSNTPAANQGNTTSSPRKKRIFLKLGMALLLLSGVMTAGFYGVLKAQGVTTNIGERTMASQTRMISNQVVKIDITGPFDVELTQNVAASLNINAEQRLLENIETVVDGDTLRISSKSSFFNSRRPIRIALNLPNLEKIAQHGSGETNVHGFHGDTISLLLRGSGDMKFDGQYKQLNANLHGSGDMDLHTGDADKVALELTGSGDINISGNSKHVQTKLNGSGDLNAENLTADTAQVDLIGSGDTDVHARQSVAVDLRGSGEVRVTGNPGQRNVQKRGSGEVQFH